MNRPSDHGEPDAVARPESGAEDPRWKGKTVINVIYGGPEGGDSGRERKRWARAAYVGAIAESPFAKKIKREPISFCDEDLPRGAPANREALMITMDIADKIVRRTLVDTGSSVNILYLDTFMKLGLDRSNLKKVKTPLAGFTGDVVEPEGSIRLPVEVGEHPRIRRVQMEFVVINLSATHNVILGRPGVEDLGAVISLEHQCLKFRTTEGVGIARSDQKMARTSYWKACKEIARDSGNPRVNMVAEGKATGQPSQSKPSRGEVDQYTQGARPEPAVELEEVRLEATRPDRTVRLGKDITQKVKEDVLAVLREYKVVFAWGPEDMPGVDRSVITHRLSVDPAVRPVMQKKRYLATDRREFVKKEVATLIQTGHIREVKYPTWLANVVLVPKPPSWRMCVDYTDLNKACPKDPFPLPRIDQLVDQTAGCALLSFMDAFRGYHQIFMEKEDEDKTAFITPDGVYCYKVMAFGLKNSGATFTRMVARLFEKLLGKTMEAYVDDLLVKSKEAADHSADLRSCLEIMKRFNLRLNPKKCAFAVKGGKFLGYLVTQRGIEPNPEKVRAIMDMQPPTNVKEVQKLTGRLAALSRFLSRSAERALPFFEIMRRQAGFEWTKECQDAFEELKKYLLSPPLLAQPKEGESLYLYLAASDRAVSSVLVREEGRAQHPVYYVGRLLRGPEVRYTPLEKVAFALVTTVRKLVPYFQAHKVEVLTDQPLACVLRSPTSSGRMIKWAMELTQYGLEYKPRPAIKAQALADFIVECTAKCPPGEETAQGDRPDQWILNADGAASARSCGGGMVLISPEGFKSYYALEYKFKASNNEAEYEAVIGGVRLAIALGVQNLLIRTDSKLVVGQIKGDYEVKGENLKLYKDVVDGLLEKVKDVEIEHIPRTENTEADLLSKMAAGKMPEHLEKICHREIVRRPSTDQLVVAAVFPIEIEAAANWVQEMEDFICRNHLPADASRAAKIKRRAPYFVRIGDQLYKKSFGGPLLKCLPPAEADRVMNEVHQGICSSHQGANTLARKLIVQGYYWPTMVQDCIRKVLSCETCQKYARREGRPATLYTPVTTAIPFARWGVDILGPLPLAPGQLKFCIVAIDYFTKWIEAEALAAITEVRCRRFLWKRVFCRFGIPEHLITDNGRQFDCKPFEEFCKTYGVRHTRVSVAYPQANGQVENANRAIMDGLRKRLEESGGCWADQLDYILWAHRTTPRKATGETPFSLTYGFEAKIPVEVWSPTRRVQQYGDQVNEETMQIEKNFLEERRDVAERRAAEYQRAVKRYHDNHAKPRYFTIGDLVLRSREASQPTQGGKMAAKWEGPYRVIVVVRPGTYKLETMEGHLVARTWNSHHLKRFYQ